MFLTRSIDLTNARNSLIYARDLYKQMDVAKEFRNRRFSHLPWTIFNRVVMWLISLKSSCYFFPFECFSVFFLRKCLGPSIKFGAIQPFIL